MEVLSWAIAVIGAWSALIVAIIKIAKKDKKPIDKYSSVSYNINIR